MKAALGNALSDRMKVIWYNWIAIQVLVFCFTISALACAADSKSKAMGFAAVWTWLLLVAYSVGGTLILRRIDYRTPLAVGFLIGVGVMVINLLLVLTVLCGGNFARWGASDSSSGAQNAVQAFSILLVMAYSTFTVFVTVYRDTLLPPPSMASLDQETHLPPPQFSSGYDAGSYGASAGADVEAAAGAVPATGGPAVL